MNAGKTLFAQVMDFVPWKTFGRIVARYDGDLGVRTLKCAELLRVLMFAQLTYRSSLREVEVCLSAQAGKLYHMGLCQPPARSTLSDALARRDWRIYYELAQRLIIRARKLYAEEPLGVALDDTVYALDATTIDLCLSVFSWAPFRKTKAAIKLHTLLDLRGSIPSFIHITSGKVHDVNVLDLLMIEPGAFYVMDRGYLDFKRLYRVHTEGAFFVTRAKSNMNARRLYSAPVDRSTGLVCDQTIALNGFYAAQDYPAYLRRIRFNDPGTGNTLVFFDEQYATAAGDDLCVVQIPLAGRVVLQVDQAASTYHPVLRNDRECGQSAGLVCREHLPAGRHREKGASIGCVSLQFITDFVGYRFRKNIAQSNTCVLK